jgi:hypothetical protein
VQSAPNAGTVVRVTLPAIAEDRSGPPVVVESSRT